MGTTNMKKIFVIGAILAILIAGVSYVAAGPGPAPNYGDGTSDGSGFDEGPGPIGDGESDVGHTDPAPNSGDGIPDGSGF